MKYFAYGSNMSFRRLLERAPGIEKIGTYKLEGHDLRFHMASEDGSGKCDALQTDIAGDYVIGVLYEISEGEKQDLDRHEQLGVGYDEKTVVVTDPGGKAEEASVYYAKIIDESMQPYTWYKKHVLTGAEEAGLPADYLTRIQKVEAWDDPDKEREKKQLLIYR